MAVNPEAATVRGAFGRQSELWVWRIAPGDEAGWLDLTQSPAGFVHSIQVAGDFNGGACRIEGSNDGENSHPLRDRFGMEANLMAPGIVGIMEPTRLIRPVVTGDAKLTITAYARGLV